MAAGKLPLGYDPLAGAMSDDPDAQLSPLAQILHNAGRNRDDENLAFAAGALQPSSNGTSGALGNAFAAEMKSRHDKDSLIAQYLPLIQQSMQQQYQAGMFGNIMQMVRDRQAAQAGGAPGAAATAPQGGPMPAGSSPGMAPAGAPAGAGNGSLVGSMSPDEIEMMRLFGGVDMTPMWKQVHEGFKHEGGSWVEVPGQGMQYFPKVSENMEPDGKGGLRMITGAAEAQARAAGLTTSAQEGAKDPYAQPTVVDTKDGPKLMTPAQARAYARGQGAASTGDAPAPTGITNPGNMRQPGQSTGFAQFKSPEEGLAAIDKQLQIYGGRGVNTVNSIISTWAPPNENDTASYIKDVSTRLGVKPDQPLDMTNPIVRQALTTAITLHEQGPSKVFAAAQGQQQQRAPGVALRSPEEKAFAEGRAKDTNTYEAGLNDRVRQGTELNMRLQEQLDALSKFKAGGGGETRAALAQYAQGMPGMPKSVVDGIAGGDLAAMQEFNKLAAQTAMEQLKQSIGGQGRVAQMEFKVFLHNNPNLSTDPDAIRKIFDFNTKLYNRDLTEQKAFNGWVDSGRNPASFQAAWAQELSNRGITAPNLKATASTTTSPTPFSQEAIAAELKKRGAIQ
jgi:hypothetical protein